MPQKALLPDDPNLKPKKGEEFSPYLRGIIMGLYTWDYANKDQQRHEHPAINNCLDNCEMFSTPRRRSGRPEALSARYKRRIALEIRRDPSITYDALRAKTGLDYTNATLLKCKKELGFSSQTVKKKSLTRQGAKEKAQAGKRLSK
ncbi:hypothetical protein Plec18167_007429 [Paecilomyces lecythidis]|uniref:HNH nuclease domain-containing protein n=1 Tax=Paecilomyces lecythidis TaxID=3004212 RepID=A0ABR3X4B2_9EURO